MRSQKISSILFHGFSFLVFYNIRLSCSIFRLGELEINQYYLGSSHIFNFGNNSKVRKREVGKNEFIFPLKISYEQEPFHLLIRKRKSDIVHENTQMLHISSDRNVNESNIYYDMKESIYLYEGYILENPYNSSINGYLKENCFYGHVINNNSFYYVDELNRYKDGVEFDLSEDEQLKRNALIYDRNFVIFTGLNNMFLYPQVFAGLGKQVYNDMFQNWKGKGMLCPLVIVLDYSFLVLIHRGNVDAATSQVLFALEEVNAIFRSTDFDEDGIPDNIGFYVKKVVVLSNEEELYFSTKYSKELLDVNAFIQKFKRFEELQHHCLGLIFTAQKFTLKTLGASFSADHKKFVTVGGICDSLIQGISFNTLVITVVTERFNPVPQIIFEITIAHELGHSFGSSHDDEHTERCSGHLMAPKTFDDYESNVSRALFSDCSKETILRTLVVKGKCFEPVRTSFCGNGIVENDEHCDCGLTRVCLQKDPCCVPRRTKERPCRVNKKKGFECHPSQGACCTEECKYSTVLKHYVNCKNFEQTCPCLNYKTKCSCGINGHCIGNECHSVECTRLGLKECPCQEDKLKNICSVCCEHNDDCMSVLKLTNKIINEDKGYGFSKTLSSKTANLNFHGKNWVFKKFCQSNTRRRSSKECVNLHFFQAKINDYCLMNGRLGKCNQSLDCHIYPNRQVFPTFKSSCAAFFGKLGVVNIIFNFLRFGFKNILF